jgi:hypothetical protein
LDPRSPRPRFGGIGLRHCVWDAVLEVETTGAVVEAAEDAVEAALLRSMLPEVVALGSEVRRFPRQDCTPFSK